MDDLGNKSGRPPSLSWIRVSCPCSRPAYPLMTVLTSWFYKNWQNMRNVDTFAHMAAIVSLKCMDVCTPEWSTLGRRYLCSKTVKPSDHKFYIPAKYFAIPKWPVRYVGGLADNPNNRMCWTIEKEKMRIKKEKNVSHAGFEPATSPVWRERDNLYTNPIPDNFLVISHKTHLTQKFLVFLSQFILFLILFSFFPS